MTATIHRGPSAIAADIRKHMPRTGSAWIYVRPYVQAMDELASWADVYGPARETAHEIGMRFLSNAGNWRGEQARLIKNEIRAALGMPRLGSFKG